MRLSFIGVALLLLAGPTRAQEAHPTLDRIFPFGRDFCLGRSYDPVHLKRHPKQTIAAIFLGGRNAGRRAPSPGESGGPQETASGNVYVTLEVRFRQKPATRIWAGTCHDEEPDAIRCGIVAHRNQDSVDQGLILRQDRAGVTLEATGDWATFRVAPDNSFGVPGVAQADRLFRVGRMPVKACSLSRAYWSSQGATTKLLRALP